MGNREYVIEKREWLDKWGEIEETKFVIKFLTKFLFWTYYKYVEHEECGWGDYYNTVTSFKTEDEAKTFIKDILCKDVLRQKWIYTDLTKLKCNK